MFSSAFICLLARLPKNYSTDYHKNQRKGGARGPRKQRLDVNGGNPADHVTLRDSWGYRYGWVGDARQPTTLSVAYVGAKRYVPHNSGYVLSNIFI